MIRADEDFAQTWPFRPHFSRAPGFAMHYVDEGSGSPVILLHGQPTWGYIYRRFIPPLAQDNRVIVPDHMGFGKSETPQDKNYTLRTHVENLSALIDALGLTDITFVMQDWGGPIGAGYAVRNPTRVRRMVFLNSTIGYGLIGRKDLPDPMTSSRWFQWVNEGLKTGRYDEVMRNLGTTVLSVMQMVGFRNFSIVDEAFTEAYASHFATPPDCLGALNFPLDVLHGRIRNYVRDGIPGIPELVKKPAIMIEGMLDRAVLPAIAIADFKGLWPSAFVHELENAGHYCQEDDPEQIVDVIRSFLRATSCAAA